MKESNALEASLACSVACEMCIASCIKEERSDCIALCRDCADICSLYARFEARASNYYPDLRILCAEICRACSAQCLKHAEHSASCKACSEACRRCAAFCAEPVGE
jgi:hypothetical protein